MIKMKYFAIPFTFCYALVSFLYAREEENFYVFGIGQGNAHLAIYKDFGVLYDCGSSSQQIHPKLKSLLSEEYIKILSKKEDKSDVKREIITINKTSTATQEEGDDEITTKEKIIDTSEQLIESNRSSESNTYSNGDSTENNIKSVIRKAIDDHHLKHFFVFISHPDADHYNKLIHLTDTAKGEEVLPTDIPVTIFLCGDWLGNLKQENKPLDEKEHIDQRLNFIRRLSRRENTWIELPYYWQYQGEEDSSFYDYQTLIDSFKKEIPAEFYAFFQPCYYPNNPTGPFQGTLKDLFLSIKTRCHGNHPSSSSAPSPLFDKFRRHFDSIFLNMNKTEKTSFDNIHIWLINQRFDDINSQSSIISFVMPDSKMHFICTGDAHDETFYHPLLSTPYMRTTLETLREDFANILIVPHHGSYGNLSRQMLEIFQPDLYLISAGNGKQHGHPNKGMIDSYIYAIQKGLIQSRLPNFFNIEGQGLFAISYIKKGETDVGYLSSFSKSYPLFSTNIHGTIKFDKDGAYSNFSDIIEIESGSEEIENQYYVVNFKQKDKKIADLLNDLNELQQKAELYISQPHSTDESIKSLASSKKRNSLESSEISPELLLREIKKLEQDAQRYHASHVRNSVPQNLTTLETQAFEDRLQRLTTIFQETEIGKNIVQIHGMYYYKIAVFKKSNKNKKSRIEEETIKESDKMSYNYYPVKLDSAQTDLAK